MPAVAVHHSLERFYNARLAGIERLIRIQPLDDFHDGVKVTLPQPAHSPLPMTDRAERPL
jgi:hypothetical protein